MKLRNRKNGKCEIENAEHLFQHSHHFSRRNFFLQTRWQNFQEKYNTKCIFFQIVVRTEYKNSSFADAVLTSAEHNPREC